MYLSVSIHILSFHCLRELNAINIETNKTKNHKNQAYSPNSAHMDFSLNYTHE